ncbi:MFS transporter [Agromyces atrinae]|uniref:Multidrug efflux pump Tap n=1 Tax=Agromyces atrinae TaxID=592376 RepID=A0A4Q2M5T0_9MICO|nr:MFS transporter [Agromyces atrinae]NYD66302.1 MFS family permease [Agromyces atrinae]RXZ86627.1 MFS transporter [Agromyces atrinae]
MNLVPFVYLASYTLSLLGNSIAAIALPLIVLQSTGSALGAGAVAAASAIPAFVVGLVAGVVIDRINRLTASVISDVISAAALAALPIVDLVTGLDIGWFVLFGIIGTIGDVPGMTAREVLLPAIVSNGRMTADRLLGLRESLGAVALLLGPAAAGTLLVVFDGSTVLWITAATSLSAAALTLLIPHRVGAIAPRGEGAVATGGWGALREGWRALFRSRFLVVVTALTVASAVALAGLQGLVLPVYFTLEGHPEMLGFVLSALALGMLVGGATYAFAATRLLRRVWLLTGLVGTTIGLAMIAALASVWLVFAGAFVVGLASGLFGALLGVLMIERIPDAVRGRVLGTQNAILTLAAPLGIVVAAVVTEYVGVGAAVLALVAVWVVAAVGGLCARSLRTLEPEAHAPCADDVRAVEHAER